MHLQIYTLSLNNFFSGLPLITSVVIVVYSLISSHDLHASHFFHESHYKQEFLITDVLDVANIKVRDSSHQEKIIRIAGIKKTGMNCSGQPFVEAGDSLYLDTITDIAPGNAVSAYLKGDKGWINYARQALKKGFASFDTESKTVDSAWLSELEWTARFQAAGDWSCMDFVMFYNLLERRFGVPDGVLYAIAMTESNYKGWPWPWSLNTISKPYRFETRQEMYEAIKYLQEEGVSFGVGPMQIEYSIHKDRFDTLWQSTSPLENVYAAISILLENYKRSKSWDKAVMNYHSYKEKFYKPYYKRFLRFYRKAVGDNVNSITDTRYAVSFNE